MTSEKNSALMKTILLLPELKNYTADVISSVTNDIYHRLKNKLKKGDGDLKEGSKKLSKESSKQSKMKKYCDEFISLAAQNNSFIKIFPYNDTLSVLSAVEIHSDEETTPEKKIKVIQAPFLDDYPRLKKLKEFLKIKIESKKK
jgi:hypothetical protein